jgi:RHS repeat-associated protein
VEAGGRAERPYRISGDGAFDRILRIRSDAAEWWEQTRKDGTVITFGKGANSQVQADRDRVFAWLVTFVSDALGNQIHYTYKSDGASNGVYLSRVDYVDLPADQASNGWLYSIVLDYGEYSDDCTLAAPWDDRPDPFSAFRSGFEIRTNRRCRRIFVLLNHVNGSEVITRYDLDYDISSGNGASLLSSVTVVGVANEEQQKSPPLTFAYSQWQPGPGTVMSIEGEVPGGGLGPGVEVLDSDGLAFPGIAITSVNGHHYLSNDGKGGLTKRNQTGPLGYSLAQDTVWLADMTGDGYADLAFFGDPPGFFAAVPGKGWAEQKTEWPGGSPINAATDNGRFADVDGDGRIDILKVRSDFFQVFHNLGATGGWGQPEEAPIPRSAGHVDFSDPGTTLADLSGDGPIDLVKVEALVHPPAGYSCRYLKYWPHYGHGRFLDNERELLIPLLLDDAGVPEDPFAHGLDPRRLKLADIDGDGYSDVVYISQEYVIVWLNNAGNCLSAPVKMRLSPTGPSDSEVGSLRVVDWFARGFAGLLWSQEASSSPLRLVYLNSGAKPYLLTAVDNHRGAAAAISYCSSATFARQDEQVGQPWCTQLPFPVHVVNQVQLTDLFAETVSSSMFRYHEGVWDGTEREFCGFARVEQDDAESSSKLLGSTDPRVSPAVRTVTWFHVGPVALGDKVLEPDFSTNYWKTPTPIDGPREAGPLVFPAADSHDWAEQPPEVRRRALRALRGKPARVEKYLVDDADSEDRRPYAITEYGYELRPEYDGKPSDDPTWLADPVTAVLARGTRISQWEQGRDPLTHAWYELNHDKHGRPQLLANISVPRGRDPYDARPATVPYLVDVTERTYATQGQNEPRHLLDRVATEIRYEVEGQSAGSLVDVMRQIEASEDLPRRVIGATATYYDGPEYQGLAQLGQLGDFGLVTRVEKMALPSQTVAQAFVDQPIPPWLTATGSEGGQQWPEIYPAEYKSEITRRGPFGGYVRHTGTNLPAGLYITDAARKYDVHDAGKERPGSGYGLVVGLRDACDVTTLLVRDQYQLLPKMITVGDRLTQRMEYDYRIQQPTRVIDANDCQTRYTYTPLGLLHTIIRSASDGNPTGDTDSEPGVVYTYGLSEYDDSAAESHRRPMWVHTLTRLVDRWTTLRQEQRKSVAANEPTPSEAAVFAQDERSTHADRFAEQRDYSDGFGRLLQSRARKTGPVVEDLGLSADVAVAPTPPRLFSADDVDTPLVRVTGSVAYDNKGRIVQRYEPFFDLGWRYHRGPGPSLPRQLRCQIIERDPRGIPVTIVNGDGTKRLFVHGRPIRLNEPDCFNPSPWESYQYDEGDNAARTHPRADPSWLSHADTPSSIEVDARGRITTVIERDGATLNITRIAWDLSGNVIEVTDALGRVCYSAVCDLLGRPWRETSLHGGSTTTIRDPLGAPVEIRDARGAITLDRYDAIHRLSRRWGRSGDDAPMLLQHAIVYGDDPGAPQEASLRNLRGRPWRNYDAAGVTVHDQYDVHNNPMAQTRLWVQSSSVAAIDEAHGWVIRTSPAWPPIDLRDPERCDESLDSGYVSTQSVCDRNGAIHTLTVNGRDLPEGTVTYLRDSAGDVTGVLIQRGDAPAEPLVDRIGLDARGQCVLVERSSGVRSRFLRDPETGMLTRQLTEQVDDRGSQSIHDMQFGHGPTGEVISLSEMGPENLPFRATTYDYDDRQRLIGATRMEATVPADWPWEIACETRDLKPCRYTFTYDNVGNILEQVRESSGEINRREFELDSATNRIKTLRIKDDGRVTKTIEYESDCAGNVLAEGLGRHFAWDHANRFSMANTGEAAARYFYTDNDELSCSSFSEREKAPTVTHRLASWVACTLHAQAPNNLCLTVTMDGKPQGEPLAWVIGGRDADASQTVHLLTDYLGSIRAILRDHGSIEWMTDYGPYGDVTSRVVKAGKEFPRPFGYATGEEDYCTKVLLLGPRSYAPWLGRFLAPESLVDLRTLAEHALIGLDDPADPPDRRTPAWALSPYCYAANSPVTVRDAGGRQSERTDACKQTVTGSSALSGMGIFLLATAIFAPEVTVMGVLAAAASGASIGNITGGLFLSPAICKPSEPLPDIPDLPPMSRSEPPVSPSVPSTPATGQPASDSRYVGSYQEEGRPQVSVYEDSQGNMSRNVSPTQPRVNPPQEGPKSSGVGERRPPEIPNSSL